MYLISEWIQSVIAYYEIAPNKNFSGFDGFVFKDTETYSRIKRRSTSYSVHYRYPEIQLCWLLFTTLLIIYNNIRNYHKYENICGKLWKI